MNTSSGVRLLMQLLTGDPLDAMEAAKRIIGGKRMLDHELLLEIAVNRKYKMWSRVAAVHSLGLLGFKRAVSDLIEMLKDTTERPLLRSHAAEALGNIGAPAAIDILGHVLMMERSNLVKKSCVYGLTQIRSDRSRSVLERAKAANPRGPISKEISQALMHSKG